MATRQEIKALEQRISAFERNKATRRAAAPGDDAPKAQSGDALAAVKALESIVRDPNTDPDDAEKAKELLQSIADNDTNTDAVMRAAQEALERCSKSEELSTRMGLRAASCKPHARGRSHVFPVQTREQAQARLARKR